MDLIFVRGESSDSTGNAFLNRLFPCTDRVNFLTKCPVDIMLTTKNGYDIAESET